MRTETICTLLAATLLFAAWIGVTPAQEQDRPAEPPPETEPIAGEAGEGEPEESPGPIPGVEPTAREKLEAIREDLIQLRLEKALANIEILLGDPGLEPTDRTEAWILRSQAHVAFGDIDAAEEDYREILRQRPAFQPEGSLTTPKAMERFEKVRAAMIGTLRIDMRPADARILVDGREVVLAGDGSLPLLAGTRTLRADRRGYDLFEESVEVAPGVESPLSLMLIPNARTVIVHTEPDGVTVTVDGEVAGLTAPRDPDRVPGSGAPSGILVIEDIPLGEHVFELERPCFRSRRLTELLTVDIMEPVPLEFETIRMEPARAKMSITGSPAGAEVRVDGEPVGAVPVDAADLCPGVRVVEVRINSRIVYRQDLSIEEGRTGRLEVGPRPNAVLVGSERWPVGFESFASTVNTLAAMPSAVGEGLETPEGWRSIDLPQDTHLALAVLPAVDEGGSDRWLLYSPLLQSVERLDLPPAQDDKPQWWTNSLGLELVDSSLGGPARVVEVSPGGPASAAGIAVGDRVLSIDSKPVETAAAARAAVEAGTPGSTVRIEIRPVDGEDRTVEVAGARSPLLLPAGKREGSPVVLAAWAEQDAIARPDRSASPLANLALLMSAAGRDSVAAETWRRVRWGDRAGVGEGTSAYYLGRALIRLGREKEAVEAFLRSAGSSSTAFDDEGPGLAAAAADHLADLGVTVD